MIQTRGFSGKLNLDEHPYRSPKEDYADALNITRDSQSEAQDEIVSNIVGNQVVADTLPLGTNKVIGNYADRTRNRHYYFTWNSDGFNRISFYDANDNSVTVVMEDLTDTNNIPVLNFNPSYRINHVDIIYRDDEWDLLYWTDGLNPPSKINVKTALDGGYTPYIIRSFIDVAKEPPSAPPYCVYEDDATVTVNNLLNKQFKFKYRFVYDDYEKSVTSAQSEIPIPVNYALPDTASDPTKNACIFLILQTGAENVTKIELLAAESLGEIFSDYFLVQVFDKSLLSINSNDVTYYKFYNNESYVTIPVNESVQPFDLVPQKALTQSLPNGNVLDYGAITENYNLVESDFSVQPDTPVQDIKYRDSLLVAAYQNAQPAFGSGDIKIIVAGKPTPVTDIVTSNVVTINTLVSATPVVITTNVAPDDTINDILINLLASAITGGYAGSITGTNELTISQTNSTIATVSVTTYADLQDDPHIFLPYRKSQSQSSKFAYDWSSRYSFGVVYFDSKGRTNGVITELDCAAELQSYNEATVAISVPPTTPSFVTPLLPNQKLTINSRPPLWAQYFQLVRTKNLSKSNFIYWISDETLKDGAYNTAGYKYAYISTNNLIQYIIDNPSTAKALGYEFAPGDRIRFIKLYNDYGITSQIYEDKDFEILESLTNPEINSRVINGQVLKILLPETSSIFNFGTAGFSNYLIEIYTPAPNYSNNLNLYYEFGQRYIIGDAGTATAYHEGQLQNQTPNLSLPATFSLYEGDSYFRFRKIPTGGKMEWTHTPVEIQPGLASPITTTYLLSNLLVNTTNNVNYTPQSVSSQSDPPTNNNFAIIVNNLTDPPTFRLKIKGKCVKSFFSQGFGILAYARKSSDGSFQNTLLATVSNLSPNVEKTFEFDTVYSPPVGYDQVTWSLFGFAGELRELDIKATDSRTINQGIIDPNFTDNYSSSATPDGRAWKIDPNAKQEFNPTLIRFGGEYQVGFTINNTNRFYESNRDVYDRSRGTIKKMFIEGRNQYIYQEFDVGVVTVLTQIVRDTAANPLSAESDKLLNKIVYPYIGQYGIGDVPESFAYGKSAKYFVDSNKGVVCRHSLDGITPLSILYKTNAFFVPTISAFKNTLNDTIPSTGTPTIYGAYDAYTNKYIIAMSAIDRGGFTQPAYTISFLESTGNSKGFESFYSYHPENIGALNNLLISFKDGAVWTHNSGYCNFYGTQYGAYIDAIFNDYPMDKKTYQSIMQTSNAVWYCPSIVSQVNSYSNTPQQTEIVAARFKLFEGQYSSAIPRDSNSNGGILNGDTMKGNYLIVRFQRDNASQFNYLNTVTLKYVNSPLNVR